MSKLAFDRWDFLGTRVVLGVIAPVIQRLRGEPLTWQLQTGRTDEVVTDQLAARSGVELRWPGTADVTGVTLLVGAVLVTLAGSFANAAVLRAAADQQGDPTTPTLELAHGIRLADDVEGLS